MSHTSDAGSEESISAILADEDAMARRIAEVVADEEALDRRIAEVAAMNERQLSLEADKLMRSKPMILWQEQEDGSISTSIVELDEPTTEMIDLFSEEPPFLITGLVWNSLSTGEKLELCQRCELDTSAVLANDVSQVLTAQSFAYVEGWQRMINEGSVWNTAGSIGRQAHALIEAGYCLYGTEPTEGFYNSGPGRKELRAGTSGTEAFVRHMMGEVYLDRLAAVD